MHSGSIGGGGAGRGGVKQVFIMAAMSRYIGLGDGVCNQYSYSYFGWSSQDSKSSKQNQRKRLGLTKICNNTSLIKTRRLF